MRSIFRSSIVCAVAIVVFASCGKDSTSPEPGTPTDVLGTWDYAEDISNGQIRCNDLGTIVLSQSKGDLTGTVSQIGSCDTPNGTVDNSGSGSVTGNVGSATIRFSFGGCDYHGDLFHNPVDSAAGDASCRVQLGAAFATLTGQWHAYLEVLPPTVSGTVSVPAGDTIAVTGEKVRLTIAASDKRGLRWVGYDLTPPASGQDSVAVQDTVFADTILFTVPASWQGSSYVHIWAKNRYGKLSMQTLGPVRALDAVRHSAQSLALGVHAADAVYDPARNVMYFTEPESAHVAVLSLATFTLGAPIPLPMVKRGLGWQGIDILPGGDTAIVALPDTSQLAFLDRVANAVTTSRINGINYGTLLRATANRKAFTIGEVDSSGYILFVVGQRDLATGGDSIRRDAGQMGHVSATATLWGSPDHSKVLVLSIGAPSCGYVYDAATDTFSSCSAFGFTGSAPGTATTNGDKWLVGDKLLDASLNVLATVPGLTPAYTAGISPDGSAAYVPAPYGYDKVALPSGALIERVRLTTPSPGRITVFPEGTRLFLWDDGSGSGSLNFGTSRATVVDLTH